MLASSSVPSSSAPQGASIPAKNLQAASTSGSSQAAGMHIHWSLISSVILMLPMWLVYESMG